MRISFSLEALQINPEVGGILVAQLGIFLQGLVENFFQARRQLRIDFDGSDGLTVKDGVKHCRGGGSRERLPTGRHLVEDDPQREQVGAAVQLLAHGLFGRHVSHSSNG